jgi:hypothetical protein
LNNKEVDAEPYIIDMKDVPKDLNANLRELFAGLVIPEEAREPAL